MEKLSDTQVLPLLLIELIEQRDYLIKVMVTTFDSDELHKFTGRLFQIQMTIDTIKQLRKG